MFRPRPGGCFGGFILGSIVPTRPCICHRFVGGRQRGQIDFLPRSRPPHSHRSFEQARSDAGTTSCFQSSVVRLNVSLASLNQNKADYLRLGSLGAEDWVGASAVARSDTLELVAPGLRLPGVVRLAVAVVLVLNFQPRRRLEPASLFPHRAKSRLELPLLGFLRGLGGRCRRESLSLSVETQVDIPRLAMPALQVPQDNTGRGFPVALVSVGR